MSEIELYEILGVGRDVSGRLLLRAYRKLNRRHHPTVNPGDPQAAGQHRLVAVAYAVLSSPEVRREYDELGSAKFFRRHPGILGEAPGEVAPAGLEKVMAEVFGPPPGLRESPAPDVPCTLRLAFADPLESRLVAIDVLRRRRCGECGGVDRGPCPACGGTGMREEKATVPVDVPAGVANGTELRIAGEGEELLDGAIGDLVVVVRVDTDPVLERKGDHVYSVIEVPVWQVALGARVRLPVAGGTAQLAIPPCTPAGRRFRLRDRGFPNPQTQRRGDHVVEVRVRVPAPESDEAREAYRRLAELFPAERA